jgi:hypothetical protein
MGQTDRAQIDVVHQHSACPVSTRQRPGLFDESVVDELHALDGKTSQR